MTTLTTQPNTLHASLTEALAESDPERALEQAFMQLGRGGSLALVLAMVKALVRVGLAGLADRLLRSASGFLMAEPQLAALAEQLAKMPPGEVPREQLIARLRRNTAMLLQSSPQLKDALANLDAAANVRVFVSAKGNRHVIRDDCGAKLDFVFPFVDQISTSAALKLPPLSISSAFLLVGVPNPAVWQKLVSLRMDNGFTPPIDIVEPDPDVLAVWLSLIDELDIQLVERISIFAGPNAVDDYRRFLVEHPTRLPAASCMTNFRPRWQPPVIDRNFVEDVLKASAARKRTAKSELDAMYAGRDGAYWRDRFQTAGTSSLPLRIVGFTTRYSTVIQHAMRDLASAFARHGCEFHTIKQAGAHVAAVDVVGELSRLRPDMILVINHLRSELIDAVPANIPYVCWIQDYMQQLWTAEAGASVGEHDLVLGHSPAVMATVYGYPINQFLPTNNLTSPDIFSAEPLDESELEPFRCDVSYAGHGSESPEQLVRDIRSGSSQIGQYLDEILRLARRLLDRNGRLTSQNLVDIVLEAESASGHPSLTPQSRRALIIPAAQRIIDRLLRHQTLQWAASWAESRRKKLRIHGRGWKNHPSLGRFASGELEHGRALRRLYQASSVSLQINGYGSLHQRLLDGLASGGFVLSRFVPADFIGEPFRAIQKCIQRHRTSSLDELMRRAATDPSLAQAMHQAEAMTGTRLAPMSDAVRAAQVKSHVQCASLSAEDFTDAGLFNLLRTLKAIPHRAAADIDGFAATTFDSEDRLHAMLDQFAGDPAARRRLAEPMRQSILKHDTYDNLVARILESFRSRWNEFGQTMQSASNRPAA